MASAPQVSVVIVNHRAWKRLDACLASLPADWETIVVDNSDEPLALAEARERHPKVQYVTCDNFGFGHACNLGAGKATSEILLFLNPDTVDRDAALVPFAKWFLTRSDAEPMIGGIRQVDDKGNQAKSFDAFPSLITAFGLMRTAQRLVAPRRYPSPRRHRDEARVDWVSGSALMIRKADFYQLGGFDEGFFMYSEDVDLCRRALALGIPCRWYAEHALTHAHGGSSRVDSPTRALTRAETLISRLRYATKHLPPRRRAVYGALMWILRGASARLRAAASPAPSTWTHLQEFRRSVQRTGVVASPRSALMAQRPVPPARPE